MALTLGPWRKAVKWATRLFGRHRIAHATLVTLAAIASSTALPARAQSLSHQWAPIPVEEFDKFRKVFEAYDVHSPADGVVGVLLNYTRIFRLENDRFCKDDLCLTIVYLDCGKDICPSTSVLAGREVRLERQIIPLFEGTQFITFLLGKDRKINVLLNKRFTTVWEVLLRG